MNRRNAVRTLLSVAGVAVLAGCQGRRFGAPVFGRAGGDGKPLSLAVHDALRSAAATNTIIIEVTSNDEGIVVLKGNVNNRLQFDEAERITLRVAGVTRVDNALFIRDLE